MISNKRGKSRGTMVAILAGTAQIALLSCGIIVAAPVYAQDTEQKNFNISSQPLAQGVMIFSDQASVQLVLDADIAAGKNGGTVSGRMTVAEAMQRLLAGTGLSWRYLNARTITIEGRSATGDVAAADGERVLGPVRVEGSQGGSATGRPIRGEGIARLGGERGRQQDEVDGFRPRVATISTGVPVAIEDVPRAISVQSIPPRRTVFAQGPSAAS